MFKTVVRNSKVIIINSILVNTILYINFMLEWILIMAGVPIIYILPTLESIPAMLIITLINKKAYEKDDISEKQFWITEIISIIILIITAYIGYMLVPITL